ncbi:nitrate- and nitrite sensing domain-containing protein [Streptomyces sp. NPDC093225]|uniref:sensor histidine kinase n=1 Tax=Streptomyces sp. NPDC093225 TaxID=3366034 RepID=UPI0038172F00
MSKKRSRKNGSAPAGTERTGDATGTGSSAGRPKRVRSRLVLGVAVVGLTVIGASAPALIAASADLKDSQSLVTLAERTRATVALAHALADERDAAVAYVAHGREGKGKGKGKGKAAVQERAARTDAQIEEVRGDADGATGRALDRVKSVRAAALTGKGSALAAHTAYSEILTTLLAPADELAERTPPRAEAAVAAGRALAPLTRAVEQASAARGLLLAALAVPEAEDGGTVFNPVTGRYEDAPAGPEAKARTELTTAGQRARVREQAALEDFDRAAAPDVRETLAATVSGPEVKAAEGYLAKLTDGPELSASDRKLNADTVGAALSARIDRMRSVESTLTAERATALAALRDDDVTEGEVLLGLAGLLLLVAVGVSTAVARTLTQPLSVLKRGAERLASPDHEGGSDPVRFTGRNDEFAAVVRSINEIHARAEAQSTSLHTRIAGLDADRRRLIDRNDALSAAKTGLDKELAELKAGLEEHRRILITTSVSLSLRTLGLVERQLAVIEQLEAKEQDPDRLDTLFKLDHLATVMRRHNENLLVLAGQEHGHGHAGPVPLVDVMRAAVSEIERYERVDLQALPAYTQVAGHAADDISHVVAELLENATTFSPPDAKVKVSGWLTDDGSVVVSVQDGGIGVTEDRLALLNGRLADPEAFEQEDEAEHGLGLGLYVAGRLAARHGVTAELRAQRGGGTEALVVVPGALLPDAPPAAPDYSLGEPGVPALQLPGFVAEANSNVLPPRFRPEVLETPAAEAVVEVPVVEDLAAGTEPPLAETEAPAAEEPVAETALPLAEVAEPVAEDPTAEAEQAEHQDRTAETEAAAATPAPEAEFDAEAEAEAETDTEFDTENGVDSEPEAPTDPFPAAETATAEEEPAPAEPVEVHEAVTDPAEPVDGVYVVPGSAPAGRGPAPVADATAAVSMEDTGAWLIAAPLPRQGGYDEPDHHARTEEAGDDASGTEPPHHDAYGASGTEPHHDAYDAHRVPESHATEARHQPLGADTDEGHEALGGAADAEAPAGDAEESTVEVERPRITDKGLPKRTPRIVDHGTGEVRKPATRVDAEELRRRLGGFYQGARDGRRVADAELAEQRQRAQDEGDTVEEART